MVFMEIIGTGHLAKTIKESVEQLGLAGDCVIIAIDTPINDDYSVELSSIYDAVFDQKDNNSLVIIMSPVPVRACKELQITLGRDLVYNPENLRIANGCEDYLYADRQIIGCSNRLKPQMEEFYKWYKGDLLFMSLESAEMVKHATNGFLAMSIGYANKIAKNCQTLGVDYNDVVRGMKADKRIGWSAYLTPGKPSKHLKRDVKILNDL